MRKSSNLHLGTKRELVALRTSVSRWMNGLSSFQTETIVE